jgi:hypothetical protein
MSRWFRVIPQLAEFANLPKPGLLEPRQLLMLQQLLRTTCARSLEERFASAERSEVTMEE